MTNNNEDLNNAGLPDEAADSSVLDQLYALLDADDTGLFDAPVKPRKLTSEDRLERGFVEILEFFDQHKREPDPDTREISERKLGARLVGIRGDEDKVKALEHLDDVGLLSSMAVPNSLDELFAADSPFADLLADDGDEAGIFDTSKLPTPKKDVAEPVSVEKREKARNFEQFEPLFQQKHAELRSGASIIAPYKGENSLKPGSFFLVEGRLAFIADAFEPEANAPRNAAGKPKHRLRIIFENATESRMYAESFSIRMYEKEGSQIITPESEFKLEDFGDVPNVAGSLYVLRSLSTDPQVSSIADLRKIGFTTTTVEQRIKGAAESATYLFAPVEVEAEYKLYGLRPSAVEHLLHKVFSSVRLEIMAKDRKGHEAGVTEWFVVPLAIIDQAIELIASGEIIKYHYDKALGQLVTNN